MWISLAFYATSLSLSKLSILLLYITLFYHTWVRRASYAILVVLFLSQVWVYYVIFTACTPLTAFWDTSIVPLDCHSQNYFRASRGRRGAAGGRTGGRPGPGGGRREGR